MKRRATDFRAFLHEIGITQAQMDAAALASPTPIEVTGDRKHRVLPSAIEGLGVFSGGNYTAGDYVCTLKVGEGWTICGRYINHDPEPNVMAVARRDDLVGVAMRDIDEGDEITLNYRQCRDALPMQHHGCGDCRPTTTEGAEHD